MSIAFSNFVYDANRWLNPFRAYILAIVFLVLSIVLGFIAVFVPWAEKDLAVATRAYAAPFKTCIYNTFSPVHLATCLDNDFIVAGGAPLTQGSKCVAYVLTTIAFVFISVIGGVFLLLAMLWLLYRVYHGRRPMAHAFLVEIGLVLEFLTSIVAWAMWIVYATTVCVPNSIFPINGFSYGFICYLFVTLCAIIAVVFGLIGMLRLRKLQPIPDGPIYIEEGYEGAYPAFASPELMAQMPPSGSLVYTTPVYVASPDYAFQYPSM